MQLRIHNFRSIRDAEVELRAFSLIAGPNNSGKSNLFAAIRAFYEKGLKYEDDRDFPKFETGDNESWVEIEFECTPEEFEQLKDEYRIGDCRFRVRKYFRSGDKDDEGKSRLGIYAYVNGDLSGSRFYGAKNVQQGKFGDVIFVPAASKLDDHTKLTGPSALRELLNSALKGIVAQSPSYAALMKAFESFGASVKAEEPHPGWSLAQIEDTISTEIGDWGLRFSLDVNPINPDDIIKSLVEHRIIDGVLGSSLSPDAFGQGFQRHLIFVLIRLAASYTPPVEPKDKKEFSPSLAWLIFEEPEAFLHPTQMDVLDASLRSYASDAGRQVTISTHNPLFASRTLDELPSLVRLCKEGAQSIVSQIRSANLDSVLAANQDCLNDLKTAGVDVASEDETLEMESIKYAIWLNPIRATAFFAERVLLVEGPTEFALFTVLLSDGHLKRPDRGVTVIDTLGKWNTHRFMNILSALRIRHSVLFDMDGESPRSLALKRAIEVSRTDFTRGIDSFEHDLEEFLGVAKSKRPDRKPQHLMWRFKEGMISPERLASLIAKVQRLLDA
ncbi:MAG: AAA family ATPase [Microgenomates group bacterium]